MNAWDLFVAFNFAVLFGALSVIAFAYWRDERRRKREAKAVSVTLVADTSKFDEAMKSAIVRADLMRRLKENR